MTTKLFWKTRIWKSLEPLLFSMMIPMLSFNILNLDFGYPTKPIKYILHFSSCMITFSYFFYLAHRIQQFCRNWTIAPFFWIAIFRGRVFRITLNFKRLSNKHWFSEIPEIYEGNVINISIHKTNQYFSFSKGQKERCGPCWGKANNFARRR